MSSRPQIISLKDRLSRGEVCVVLGIGRALHHNLLQMIGLVGEFHGVWFDMEHVGLTTEQLEVATLACRAHGLDSICRVAPTDYAIVTRCLEAGATGIMAAQITSVEQAIQFVHWAKFFPAGMRGLNTSGWDARFTMRSPAEFVTLANEETCVWIQIETVAALEACADIAAIEGVDGLFVGPSDLSQSLGVTGQFMHARCLQALETIASACSKARKFWGAVTVSPEHAQYLKHLGCRLFSPANDVKVFLSGLYHLKNQYRDLFAGKA